MSVGTPRFALPFILPGQAQKELFHNEALMRLDVAMHAAVEGVLDVPPLAPGAGECWIVASGAGGSWTGRASQLAAWTEGGWRFVAPRVGMSVWNKGEGFWNRWTGGAWSYGEVIGSKLVVGGLQVVGARQPEVPSPSGGTIIDEEARAAVQAVIVALKSHGLTE